MHQVTVTPLPCRVRAVMNHELDKSSMSEYGRLMERARSRDISTGCHKPLHNKAQVIIISFITVVSDAIDCTAERRLSLYPHIHYGSKFEKHRIRLV